MKSFSNIAIAILMAPCISGASVKRISSTYKDLSTSQKIYLHAGLISVVEFPQNILEVRVGNTKTVKVDLSQVSGREMTLQLLSADAKSTNIIVKSEKKFYIFDVVPSRTSHQDLIRIRGAYGPPNSQPPQNPLTLLNWGLSV